MRSHIKTIVLVFSLLLNVAAGTIAYDSWKWAKSVKDLSCDCDVCSVEMPEMPEE